MKYLSYSTLYRYTALNPEYLFNRLTISPIESYPRTSHYQRDIMSRLE